MDDHQGVPRPGASAGLVGPPSPQIDHELSVDHDRERRSELVPLREVPSELIADGAEARMGSAVHLGIGDHMGLRSRRTCRRFQDLRERATGSADSSGAT